MLKGLIMKKDESMPISYWNNLIILGILIRIERELEVPIVLKYLR